MQCRKLRDKVLIVQGLLCLHVLKEITHCATEELGQWTHLKMAYLSSDLLRFSPLKWSEALSAVGNGEPSLSYDMRDRSDIPKGLCSRAGA